jgi:hypothetical protein
LARAFDLLRRALSELPSPVGHEALRLRMSALLGREDGLLEASRFSRLLRQAHDAEIADVRKIGEDEFEVIARGVEPAPAGSTASSASSEVTPLDPLPVTSPADAAARGGIRFRRGSRLPVAPPSIAMVGVVKLDDEPVVVERPAKGRKKAAKPAELAAEATPKEAPAKKKAARPRAKKKVEG